MTVDLPEKNIDLAAAPKLDLLSIRELEFKLGLERGYLRTLAAHAGGHYNPFVKPEKVFPFQRRFKNKKKRIIDNPDEQLRDVQKRIYRRLLRPESLPDYIYGGVTNKCIQDNVNRHLGARMLVTVDIANFFPSVTNEYIYWLWNHVLRCSSEISILLTKLTSFERHLPQGAATSTPLANILICTIDKQIRSECERMGITYSTWVDDLAFSGDDPRRIIPVVIGALRKSGLRLSRKKITIMGPATRKVLNGIVLGKKLGVTREVRSRIRAGIHRLKTGAVPIQDQPKYMRSLIARIRQAETINSSQIQKLRSQLAAVLRDRSIALTERQQFLKQLGCA
ncbi:MAG: reverse transcriptase family protein [Acidobacteriia bacterium]|nr:reverse transcriptase family protein [Terriglobia bacterium]